MEGLGEKSKNWANEMVKKKIFKLFIVGKAEIFWPISLLPIIADLQSKISIFFPQKGDFVKSGIWQNDGYLKIPKDNDIQNFPLSKLPITYKGFFFYNHRCSQTWAQLKPSMTSW